MRIIIIILFYENAVLRERNTSDFQNGDSDASNWNKPARRRAFRAKQMKFITNKISYTTTVRKNKNENKKKSVFRGFEKACARARERVFMIRPESRGLVVFNEQT